ncbi:hypothetical protein [Leucobacter sp. wl10]|uniref:hypothetical protein n=1 Tax=Leucobacter sp. wl10 TaxID=2304677 RepID=UPI0013C2F1C5|nr:hypothetical protein [Leucobacter sp. wl10]
MTSNRTDEQPEPLMSDAEESPQSLPPKAWVTLVLFAAFVLAFGSCASLFMFN